MILFLCGNKAILSCFHRCVSVLALPFVMSVSIMADWFHIQICKSSFWGFILSTPGGCKKGRGLESWAVLKYGDIHLVWKNQSRSRISHLKEHRPVKSTSTELVWIKFVYTHQCLSVSHSSDEFTPVEGDEKNNTSESSSEGIVCSCCTWIKTSNRDTAISWTSAKISTCSYTKITLKISKKLFSCPISTWSSWRWPRGMRNFTDI